MTKEEFLQSISNGCVVISLEKYEQMVEAKSKLDFIKQIFEDDESNYGLCSNSTKTIKSLLELTKEEKKNNGKI